MVFYMRCVVWKETARLILWMRQSKQHRVNAENAKFTAYDIKLTVSPVRGIIQFWSLSRHMAQIQFLFLFIVAAVIVLAVILNEIKRDNI